MSAEETLPIVFSHLEKTGGTSLSVILAATTNVICGSALSEGWLFARCNDDGSSPLSGRPCSTKPHRTQPGSQTCLMNSSLPWFHGRIEQQDKYQRERLTRGISAAAQAGLRGRDGDPTSLSSAFAHESPAIFMGIFPQGAKLLLLFRQPDAHRRSYFAAMRNLLFRDTHNYSDFLRSSAYYHAHSMQLRWAHDALVGDGTPLRLVPRTDIDPISTARALFEYAMDGSGSRRSSNAAYGHRHVVVWVGLAELWDSSMCSLSRALGLGGGFYKFARAVHTRRYRPASEYSSSHVRRSLLSGGVGGANSGGGASMSYEEGDLNTLHLATTTSREDYAYLLTLERDEFMFISLVGRHIQELLAQEGPCECEDGGLGYGAAIAADNSTARLPRRRT